MTAQATAMPRQHPYRLTTEGGNPRLRRRALLTATIALAAPLVAVTTLVALGAVTDTGGAGLGSLPGTEGLKGASARAEASEPLVTDEWDTPDKARDHAGDRGSAPKPTRSGPPPEPSDPVTVVKQPREPVVPVGGRRTPAVTEVPDPSEPGYPGGISSGTTGYPSSSGPDSGSSTGSGSGNSGSGNTGGERDD